MNVLESLSASSSSRKVGIGGGDGRKGGCGGDGGDGSEGEEGNGLTSLSTGENIARSGSGGCSSRRGESLGEVVVCAGTGDFVFVRLFCMHAMHALIAQCLCRPRVKYGMLVCMYQYRMHGWVFMMILPC